jgi:hypothetical protein
MPRVNPSDEIDTVAYAVSFMKAAKCLAGGEEEWEDNHSLIVPFYMLIGFSLENALKAVLEFNGSDPGTKWSHSHDLQKLRLLAEHHDFVLSDDLREFVDHLSPLHKDHHFRYPQKAEAAHLLKPIAATELTESYLWKRSWPSMARNAWTTEGSKSPCETVAEPSQAALARPLWLRLDGCRSGTVSWLKSAAPGGPQKRTTSFEEWRRQISVPNSLRQN